MKHLNDRYSTRCSLVRTLLSVMSIMFVLTACDQGNSTPPLSPSFSLSQGKIYIQYNADTNSSVSDTLAVFRADTGKFLWKAADDRDAPIADNTTVYIPTQTTLIARDVESGKERWRTSEPLVPRAVIDGILYTSSLNTPSSPGTSTSSFVFTAFQANDGQQLWTAKLSGYDVQQLEGDQGRIFVRTDEGFSAFQVDDGKLLWSTTAPLSSSAFTSANGMIYLSRDKVLDALDASNGNRLWTFHTKEFFSSLPVVASNGILCVITRAVVPRELGELYGLRAKDGVQLWKQPDDFSPGTMVTANGVVYVISADKGLFAVQAKDGSDLWQFSQDADSVNRDENSGIFYTTTRDASVAAVGTDGRLLWKIPRQTDEQGYPASYLASNGIVYQLIPGGLAGTSNEQRYPWADLTATRGRDGKSLWSKHLQF